MDTSKPDQNILFQSFLHISGASFNPAVSLAAALSGRERGSRALLLVSAQLAGAALAAAARDMVPEVESAVLLTGAANAGSVLLTEIVLGGAIALVYLRIWDGKTDSAPITISFSVTALSLAAVSKKIDLNNNWK